MKLLKTLLFSLLLGSSAVYADRVDELLEAPSQQYCSVAASLFQRGAQYRNMNIPLIFKNVSAAEAEAGDPPGDAIYMIEWDSYTDQEKAWVSGRYSDGWLAADQIIRQAKEKAQKEPENQGFDVEVGIDPAGINHMTQTYFEGCLYKNEQRKHEKQVYENPLRYTASSKQLTCELRSKRFLEACLRGRDLDQCQ